MHLLSLLTGSYKNRTKSTGRFKETESYEKGFSDHYQQNIKPHVSKYEELRINSLNIVSKRARIGVPIYIFILISCFYVGFLAHKSNRLFEDNGLMALMFIVFSLNSLILVWIYKPIRKYSSSIKAEIFPNILSFFGDFKYQEKEEDLATQRIAKTFSSITSSTGISTSISNLEESDIIPNYNKENSEDFIKGKYKEVDIKLFETKLELETNTGKHYSCKTVFKGIVIFMSIHKNFNGKTIIINDKGRLKNWLKNKFSKLDNVKLEDPKFEKLFEVFADDQIEARYLLTTSFMERLLQLQESFKGQKIESSFYDNNLLMMIPIKKNLFEPGSIFEPEDFIDDSKSLLKEMNIIFQIIDILKLNQNIGL